MGVAFRELPDGRSRWRLTQPRIVACRGAPTADTAFMGLTCCRWITIAKMLARRRRECAFGMMPNAVSLSNAPPTATPSSVMGLTSPMATYLGSYRLATAPEPNSLRLTSFKSTRLDSPANNVGPWPTSLGCTTSSYSAFGRDLAKNGATPARSGGWQNLEVDGPNQDATAVTPGCREAGGRGQSRA